MQIKTIQKTIASKLNEWLLTIKDESLRKKLTSNILVSGGSITSMLLNEKVNDYDVYIKDLDILLDLAKYYVGLVGKDITILDGRLKSKLVEALEKDYKYYLKEGEDVENINNAYAISVRNLKEDQIKLFTITGGMRVNEGKKEEELNYDPVYFSPNAISLSNQLQIVLRFHGDDVAIHKTFDFIHATNYFTFDSGLVTNKEALESIITKQLKYQGSLYPLTSIIRMKKFVQRGWNINAGEILKMMFQVSELDLKNPDVLEEQITGVDVAYFSKLIEIMRGVKLECITSQYLNSIIDKVFNSAEESE